MELLIITQNRISLSLQSGRILQCDLFGLSTDRELGRLKKWIQVRSWRFKLEGVWQIHSLCWQAFFLFLLTPSPCLPLLHVPLGYEVREHGKKVETPPPPPPPSLFVCFFFARISLRRTRLSKHLKQATLLKQRLLCRLDIATQISLLRSPSLIVMSDWSWNQLHPSYHFTFRKPIEAIQSELWGLS